jgi:hypothetical protein
VAPSGGEGVGPVRRAEIHASAAGGVEASLGDHVKVAIVPALGVEVAGGGARE